MGILSTSRSRLLTTGFLLTLLLIFTGCASSPDQGEAATPTDAEAPAEQTKTADAAPAADTVSEKSGITVSATNLAAPAPATPVAAAEQTIAAPGAVLLTPVEILSYENRGIPSRPTKQADAVTKFCVAQPYAKHKKQVIDGINSAWEKTKAGTYGVGFRNKKEYEKWNKTQKDFFLYMFDACQNLAMCKEQGKKSKKKNACGVQQAKFDAWQNSARYFAKTVKSFQDEQPPSLCGLRPDNKDASLCFERRSQQIREACGGEICDELSNCWRDVAIKDQVIRQAESSCGFSGQKLSQCSGYIGAVQNRKAQFDICKNMEDGLSLTLQ